MSAAPELFCRSQNVKSSLRSGNVPHTPGIPPKPRTRKRNILPNQLRSLSTTCKSNISA
ncbi:hypothetical protein HBI56_190230 [Parastagonospora nodorum]|uniref:Uncharacterized protein n=1 Tax=Phaeosphaeria nodorum (strain SN15 / ATCC MYA-4574 / FGSC 10173) TaxID=321614 RepID=A0A7U2FAG6_PHANO|nr:hypothetical protein HBH56_144220 [Parastagonospora nodorum]QRD01423.1 hypothetical protein JI435_416620 [Parastagonospora nodorum SN15]KAH3927655.1 hypothetical protein HBH54_149410 [Parastagonospora nodorum]KAH3962091.1 hypothetical protein HBH51_178060 [Parastagonospora nodorum]KAH3997921.1 hypothetical protein HBI10_136820 [Parastagonospora nodorum]